MLLASGISSVARKGGHRGLMEVNIGVQLGLTARGGGAEGGGCQQWRGLQPLRTALHVLAASMMSSGGDCGGQSGSESAVGWCGTGEEWSVGARVGCQTLSTALHTMSIRLQNSFLNCILGKDWAERFLESLMPYERHLFILSLKTKVKWVRRKIVRAKNRIEKDRRANIIATNFVQEQLKTI